jgi:Uma2 family endonuclease
MSTTAALTTVEEFLRLPEPRAGHYELHHGEVVLIAPPKWGHEEIQERVRELLKRSIGDRGTVRVEMAFRPIPEFEVWRADVGVVGKERAERTNRDGYLQGAPDLVVEVLSPSNTAQEINDKMAICLQHGCLSFWVIDDNLKEVKITEGDITRRYTAPAAITSEIAGATIRVQVQDMFQGS